MRKLNIPSFTLAVACTFFLYTIVLPGCGSSAPSTKHLDKYDQLPYRDTFTLNGSGQTVYRAAIRVLQQEGYIVSLSDPQTGLINAELNSGQVLAEEAKASQPEESSGTSLFWTIIGFVFLFGLIALIIGSEDSEQEQKDERSRFRERDPSVDVTVEDSKTISYRYIVTINANPIDETSTEVQISAVRMQLENGGVVDSRRLQNKYLNYRLVDLIEIGLSR